MDIRIGVPVRAEDGQAGKVERIIVHPDTNQISGVVVTQGGMLARDVVIPSERILGGNEDHLLVRGTVDEIGELEPFAQSQYTEAPEDWIPPVALPSSLFLFPASSMAVGAFDRGSPEPPPPPHEVADLEPGEVDISGTTTVFCADGEAGKVDRVITEPDSDTVTHLVVQRGSLLIRDIVVPVNRIATMDEEGIVLTLTREELDDLPSFEGYEDEA